MPTLRELQKRLESAQTIKQLSGAMRSAATAKYTKLCALLDRYAPYAAALRDLYADLRASNEDHDPSPEITGSDVPPICILISGNRGLCGGYHQQLFAFFAQAVKDQNVRIATVGKKALDFCRSKKIPVDRSFIISDVPSFAHAGEIAGYVRDLVSKGETRDVFVCFQHFHNMLRSEPTIRVILRSGGDNAPENDGVLFIPDRRSVEEALEDIVLDSDVYDVLLSAATGAQAATLVAMRAAYENANSSISSLEIAINRLRQAAVTAGVLETATDEKEQV